MSTAWIERQLTEIQSLQAIYCEEGELSVDADALAGLSALGAAADDINSGGGLGDGKVAPVTLSVRLSGVGHNHSAEVRLSAVLPLGYPSGDAMVACSPVVWLEPLEGASVAATFVAGDDDVCAGLQTEAQVLSNTGDECLLQLVQFAEELVRGHLEDASLATAAVQDERVAEEDAQLARAIFEEEVARVELRAKDCPPQLGRRAMFSHHIIAASKRQAISQWAQQLRLGGIAKIGWPGLIIVEGNESDVRAYVEALSRLRWKHFVVRGEQVIEGTHGQCLDDLRALPLSFEEFGPDTGMSEFASRCRQHGLEELFLIALKLPSTTSSGGAGRLQLKAEHPEEKEEAATLQRKKGQRR